ncbi:MAG: alpha/beta fold hydrolase [Crocinitomicaceae bacterium]
MNIAEGHITFQKKGRYFTYGSAEDGKDLLIVLHGYGYLAKYFIKKFEAVNTDRFFVICPEGLHRFYHSGTNGRVGASWMTKEDRLNDIEDYVCFLNELLRDFKSRYQFNTVTLLGFSQGGATACRWLAYGNHSFDKFILWATVFPPDMEKEYNEKFKHSSNFFVFGTEDEYYSEDMINSHFEELKSKEIPFKMIKFEGKHTIDSKTLLTILHD